MRGSIQNQALPSMESIEVGPRDGPKEKYSSYDLKFLSPAVQELVRAFTLSSKVPWLTSRFLLFYSAIDHVGLC